MNRFHVILRLQKLYPDCEIFCSVDKGFIIIRKVLMYCRIDAKFNVPLLNQKTIHVDTARLMFLREKYKLKKN